MAFQLSEIKYFNSIEELLSKVEYCEPDFYIRIQAEDGGTGNQKDIEEKLNDLFIPNPESDDLSEGVLQVLNPFVVYTSPRTQKEHILNGNGRARALELSRTLEEWKDKPIAPIPYQEFLSDATEENLLAFQRYSNDTTKAHSVLEKARKADEFNEKRLAYYKKQGLGQQEAKSKATQDVKRILGNKSDGYVSQLRQIAKLPDFVRKLIEVNILSADTAINSVAKAFKKIKDVAPNYDLEAFYQGLQSWSIHTGNKGKIDPKTVVDPYTESLIASFKGAKSEVNGNGSTPETKKDTTLKSLQDDKILPSDVNLAELNKQLGANHLKEKDIAEALKEKAEKGEVITADVITTTINEKKPKPVDLEGFRRSVSEVSELISPEIVRQAITNNNVNKEVHDLIKASSLFIAKTNKFFNTSEAKDDLELPLFRVVFNRLNNLEASIGNNNPDEKLREAQQEIGDFRKAATALNAALNAPPKQEETKSKAPEKSQVEVITKQQTPETVDNSITPDIRASDEEYELAVTYQ